MRKPSTLFLQKPSLLPPSPTAREGLGPVRFNVFPEAPPESPGKGQDDKIKVSPEG